MSTILVILDVETTGLTAQDDVIQVASVIHEEGAVDTYTYVEFAKPTAPVHPKATEVHGYTAEDLKDYFPSEVVVKTWWNDLVEFAGGGPVIFAGHNVSYDFKMLSKYLPGVRFDPSICTLQLARRELKSERNTLEFLYSQLGIDDPRADSAHDALADCWRCFHLLQSLQKRLGMNYPQLAEHCGKPQQVASLPFGKYKGVPLKSVDRGYLQWLQRQGDLNPDVAYSIKEVLKRG
jgi:exodeoxyribonuclease X